MSYTTFRGTVVKEAPKVPVSLSVSLRTQLKSCLGPLTVLSYSISDLILVGNFLNEFHCFAFCLVVLCLPM